MREGSMETDATSALEEALAAGWLAGSTEGVTDDWPVALQWPHGQPDEIYCGLRQYWKVTSPSHIHNDQEYRALR
jgi:hypothetical protein